MARNRQYDPTGRLNRKAKAKAKARNNPAAKREREAKAAKAAHRERKAKERKLRIRRDALLVRCASYDPHPDDIEELRVLNRHLRKLTHKVS